MRKIDAGLFLALVLVVLAAIIALSCGPEPLPNQPDPPIPPTPPAPLEPAPTPSPITSGDAPFSADQFTVDWWRWGSRIVYTGDREFRGRICVCSGAEQAQVLVGEVPVLLFPHETSRFEYPQVYDWLLKPACWSQLDLTADSCACPAPTRGGMPIAPLSAVVWRDTVCTAPTPPPTPPPCVDQIRGFFSVDYLSNAGDGYYITRNGEKWKENLSFPAGRDIAEYETPVDGATYCLFWRWEKIGCVKAQCEFQASWHGDVSYRCEKECVDP